ncbi:MAG: HAMP domain-containing protein [Chloroflexi bacterium]|nr:HAMP domain-containing protein [Chloroflexota bacterium]
MKFGVRTKIILPYLLLTILIAGVGTYVVTQLVASNLQERFDNQLLDAGRIVASGMITAEEERLQLLRAISFTTGLVAAVQTADAPTTAALVEPLILNQPADVVIVLPSAGPTLYTWPASLPAVEYRQLPAVQRALRGEVDALGDKRALLATIGETPYLFTVGPLTTAAGEPAGAVLVGTAAPQLVRQLTNTALARVTLYTPDGRVLATTLGQGTADQAILYEDPAHYTTITTQLAELPSQHEVVSRSADTQVPLRQVEIIGQAYQIAFGDWRLRQESFGLFSVALPSNFIVSTTATNRNWLAFLFSLATMAVLGIGLLIAERILTPLDRLVRVSTAVVQGDLDQRTGVTRTDEIGVLATAFDTMTNHLVARNRDVAYQASNLQAILNSIADGVLVFDQNNKLIHANAAAQAVRQHTLLASRNGHTADLPGDEAELAQLFQSTHPQAFRRYAVSGRVYSASVAPVLGPTGEPIGRVVVLRDITLESEAEHVKDAFIQNISHELRTPLTSIKGYLSLLQMTAAESFTAQQQNLVRVASTNTDLLVEQVNQLIELSELQAGQLKLNLQQLNLVTLAEQEVTSWQARFAEKQIALSFSHSADQLWVEGDPVRLRWMLNSLLDNAQKYTPAAGQVKVHIGRKGNQAQWTVSDTGVGVREVDIPYLFTPFFRGQHGPEVDIRGMGLGLFIVQALAKGHGGHTWVQSRTGEGSTFGVLLPLMVRPEQVAQMAQMEAEADDQRETARVTTLS